MDALAQLERLRREALERARVELHEARTRDADCERALTEARRAAVEVERKASQALHAFAQALSVLELRSAELQLATRRVDRAASEQRVLRCESAHAETQRIVAERMAVLRDAELGRRAVDKRLAQRASDVGRRTERLREEEADEAFRASRAR